MCMCEKPNINGEPGYSWNGKPIGVCKPNPPEINDDVDGVIFDEPGRCDGTIDSHCHHYTVVKRHSRYVLLVRNGSGDKEIRLSNGKAMIAALQKLDSNSMYWVLNSLNHAASDAKQTAIAETNQEWRQAAAEKRIKTRKQRNGNGVKVWIELTPA